MKKLIICSLFLSVLATSCKKDDKNCDLNAANFAGTYKFTALTYKANTATPPVDEFAFLDACEKDDIIIFNANNTSSYTDAGVVCVPDGNGTGTWSLTGSTALIDGEIATVASFDCTGMTLTFAGTDPGELSTITLQKQ